MTLNAQMIVFSLVFRLLFFLCHYTVDVCVVYIYIAFIV